MQCFIVAGLVAFTVHGAWPGTLSRSGFGFDARGVLDVFVPRRLSPAPCLAQAVDGRAPAEPSARVERRLDTGDPTLLADDQRQTEEGPRIFPWNYVLIDIRAR